MWYGHTFIYSEFRAYLHSRWQFSHDWGDSDWLAFGFVSGRSTSNSKSRNRFLAEETIGIAWSLVKYDNSEKKGVIGNTSAVGANPGLADQIAWPSSSSLNAQNPIDLRIVLDTSAGSKDLWAATWYAKSDSDTDFSDSHVVVSRQILSSADSINAVGFGVGDGSVNGSVSHFSLSSTVSVPELNSYALILACFSLICVTLRRRCKF